MALMVVTVPGDAPNYPLIEIDSWSMTFKQHVPGFSMKLISVILLEKR